MRTLLLLVFSFVAPVLFEGTELGKIAFAAEEFVAALPPGNQAVYERLASEQAACGPNSLFAFLRLRGAAVEYARVVELVPRDTTGASIAAIQEASQQLGHSVAVVHVNWVDQDVRNLDYPIMAHEVQPASKFGGHYVVLLACDDSRITYIDGTSGRVVNEDWAWMRKRLSGYCIVSARGGAFLRQYSGLASALCAFGIALPLFAAVRRIRRAGTTALLVACVATGGASVVSGAEGVKRISGSRSLALLLHAYGKDPGGISSSTGEYSLRDVQANAQAAGLPLMLSRARPSDLTQLPTPFLATLEVSPKGRHAICLVHYVGDDFVDMIDDATASHYRLQKSVFVRGWSGHVAYVPCQASGPGLHWPLAAGLIAGLVVLRGRTVDLLRMRERT